jgi:iron complex outermembrane receptor protein
MRAASHWALSLAFAVGAAAPSLADPAEGNVLEEIVVTAQKREQSLQNVPISVTALSGTSLRDAGVITMEGVSRMVPSLTTIQNDAPIDQSYRIRGIGSDPNIPTFEPDVGLFIDGAYLPRSGLGVEDLVDLERIEVLSGPQSTLYGKNVTAGVINLVTRTRRGANGRRRSHRGFHFRPAQRLGSCSRDRRLL